MEKYWVFPEPHILQVAISNRCFEVVEYLIEIQHYNITSINISVQTLYPKYLFVCEKGVARRKEKASKRIYFWWIQKIYDINNLCGNRMVRRNYDEYKSYKLNFLKKIF